MSDYHAFYGERRSEGYGRECGTAESHDWFPVLEAFVRRHDLRSKRCLEIGSATGLFQDLVADYTGTDLSPTLARHYRKPYRAAEGTRYPFPDASFDAIWTITVFEHIPDLQAAMLEIERLLRPGGVLLFAPAWQCRPWAAEGYAVRPYRDLGLRGKLVKASIPIRDSVLWRSMFVFPKRAVREVMSLAGYRFENIRYRKLRANYETYWTSDSDACNSIDPHDALLWFRDHGFECLSHPTRVSRFLVRTGALELRKRRPR
jgi:SAM-dependent methyltransferase